MVSNNNKERRGKYLKYFEMGRVRKLTYAPREKEPHALFEEMWRISAEMFNIYINQAEHVDFDYVCTLFQTVRDTCLERKRAKRAFDSIAFIAELVKQVCLASLV